MIAYPEIRGVKQQGCRILYWGLSLLGVMAFLFFLIRSLEFYRVVSTVVRWSISKVLLLLFATDF